MKKLIRLSALGGALLIAAGPAAVAQDASVKPGINDRFQNPDPEEYAQRWEKEGREIYDRRQEIVAACALHPGMTVADIGAGTGLFTRLFAPEVAPGGRVFAVDIAAKFVDHILRACERDGIDNVKGVVCLPDDAGLPANSVDLAFICDTYHHFEFPAKTMRSIHKAVKDGGNLVIIDFKRVPGQSSDWVLSHVRAGQDEVRKEVESFGFAYVEEHDLLQENYLMVFRKQPDRAR